MVKLDHLIRMAIASALVLASGGIRAAAEPDSGDLVLPAKDKVFAVGFQAQPTGTLPYFDERLFMALYPHLRPAKVKVAVGARRQWQRGVIVTKDKEVVFWSTCARTFIAVDTAAGQRFFAREAEVFVP